MALSDAERREVEVGLADGIFAVHRQQKGPHGTPACAWCLVDWPCRQAEFAQDIRARHAAERDS